MRVMRVRRVRYEWDGVGVRMCIDGAVCIVLMIAR